MAKLEWVCASRGFWRVGKWEIWVDINGRFHVTGLEDNGGFASLDGAKACCQLREDAAAPVELPTVGDVWEVPGKPETRRLVHSRTTSDVQFSDVGGECRFCWFTLESWRTWVYRVGAVRIDGEGKHDAQWREELAKFTDLLEYAKSELDAERARVKELEGEVVRLRAEHEAVQAERNRLREWKASVSNAIQNIPEFAAGKWGGDKDGWGYHFEVVQYLIRNRDELRTKVGLMEEEAEAGRGTPLKGAAYVRVGRAAGRAEIRERAEKAEREWADARAESDKLRIDVGNYGQANADLRTKLHNEKLCRVYYQDIVYWVCGWIDRLRSGERVVCGSVSEPCDGVQRGLMDVLAKWQAVHNERDNLRAARGRLMEALRGIESDADAALSGAAFVVKLTSMRDRAREARLREEGGKS